MHGAVVHLRCSSNNKAETALQCFTDGVNVFGILLRVRADKGIGNQGIARFIVGTRSTGQGSFIWGTYQCAPLKIQLNYENGKTEALITMAIQLVLSIDWLKFIC